MTAPEKIVVTDFDGTLTSLDIGNELCRRFIPEKFDRLYRAYRDNKLSLRDYQNELWTDFPLSAKEFEQESRHFAKFRNGTEAFLEACADLGIKVFVASCGIDAYILPTLAELPEKAQRAIAGLRCNQAVFESKQLKQIQMPSLDGPYSLDKGAWCQEIRNLNSRPCEILGIGNGTSDRSMVGFTDRLAATESLAEHLEEKKIDHSYFESFSELVPLLKEARWA